MKNDTSLDEKKKKIVVPSESTKSLKPKKHSFLLKKLKLKSKSPTRNSVSLSLPKASTAIARQTPEGDDNFSILKSVSETNLAESWINAEDLKDSVDKSRKRRPSEIRVCEVPERTKSLENLKDMPAYGDLIVEISPSTVIFYFK